MQQHFAARAVWKAKERLVLQEEDEKIKQINEEKDRIRQLEEAKALSKKISVQEMTRKLMEETQAKVVSFFFFLK